MATTNVIIGSQGNTVAVGTPITVVSIGGGIVGTTGAQGIPGAAGTNGTNGVAGTNGTNGAAGAVWRTGAGVPSNALGIDGDYYLNTTTSDVYQRAAGIYAVVVNIKGAAGAAGTAGTNGTNGAAGAPNATTSVDATTATRTLALTDASLLIEMDFATACTVVIPTHATVALPMDFECFVRWYGVGQPTINGAALGTPPEKLSAQTYALAERYSIVMLKQTLSFDHWEITGDLYVPPLIVVQTVGDADATIAVGTTDILLATPLTAARNYTLPSAGGYLAGQRITFTDKTGSITATNTVTLTAAASESINNATTRVFNVGYAVRPLVSDGAAKWTEDVRGIAGGGTGAITQAGAQTALGIGTAGLLPIDIDGTLSANSDTRIATQKATKTYADSLATAAGGLKNIAMIDPIGGQSIAPTTVGINLTTLGTATFRAAAATNYFTQARRVGYLSAATAGSSSELRGTSSSQVWLGNAAGLGGFYAVFKWGASDGAAVSGARSFNGFVASGVGAIANADPSAMTSMFGVGNDSADTNLQFMHNDGTGVALKTDLGASFSATTLNTDLIELIVQSVANSGTITYKVTNKTTGATTGNVVLSTELPATNQFLNYHFWRNNGATALAVGLDLSKFYMEMP